MAKCCVTATNYGPLGDVNPHDLINKELYVKIDDLLMIQLEKIINSGDSLGKVKEFATAFKHAGGLGMILAGANYDDMQKDLVDKVAFYKKGGKPDELMLLTEQDQQELFQY